MNKWQPLAPTKRASGAYVRANDVGPSNSFGSGSGGGSGDSADASTSEAAAKPKEALTKEERRAAMLRGPSDPFPPVGAFPRSVAVHILSFLSLSEQRSCSLAGRALAAAVADERNWRRRIDALDWCKVDGLAVHFDGEDDEEERDIGRRRKGKRKEHKTPKLEEQEESESALPAAKENSAPKSPISAAPPSLHVNGTSKTTAQATHDEDEDDFGDFSGPSTEAKDTFTDFPFENNKLYQSGGSSLASGMASVAIGGGRPHNFNALGAPIFTPLTPVKLGSAATPAANGSLMAGARPNARSSMSVAAVAAVTSPARNGSIFSYAQEATLPLCSKSPSFRKLRAYAKALRPFVKSLEDRTSPATNSLLFTCDLGLSAQTALLSNLLRYFSTSVGGGGGGRRRDKGRITSTDGFDEDENSLSIRGQDAARRLLSNLLSSFEGTLARRSDAVRAATHGADTARAIRRAETDMLTHANGIWELGNARLALALSEKVEIDDSKGDLDDQFGRMKAASLFLERLDIFASGGLKHDPLENLSKQLDAAQLDFTAMDTFMADLIDIVKKDGDIIARVFPPEQDVLLAYAENVAQDVISKYIHTLLNHVKHASTHMYLRSCAATFAQSWKLVDVLLSVEPRDVEIVTQARCEDVVFRMWEANMDEYLRAENDWVRQEMQAVTERWESDVENDSTARVDAAFLGSQNPAAVKRSVLSGFKDVLLLPVTVVPRTAGIVGGAVIRTAGTGLSTLNPLRWQSGGASSGGKATGNGDVGKINGAGVNLSSANLPRTPNEANERGYMDFSSGAVGTMDSDSEDDDNDRDEDGSRLDLNEHDEWNHEVAVWSAVASSRPEDDRKKAKRQSKLQAQATSRAINGSAATAVQRVASASVSSNASRPTTAVSNVSSDVPRVGTPTSGGPPAGSLTQMQLLLSLDTALQVIHVNRDCLKRIETFKKYPSPNGERVREAIQEVSLLLFRALGEGHITPGFEKATAQIQQWKPEEHVVSEADDGEEKQVEPLVHFFELVHVGDTIAQMVQVYFDQEISQHIDKNDFLNPVVKGRKKFEGNLDEAVARGLNAGVDLLLGQAEHLISTRQNAKDYNPPVGQLTDLTPTRACKETVECLRVHCRMLVGSTDKNVLEVFYQEVGIRLYAIICKHLKSQVISLDGGFRVIADLNEYQAFVATLRQASLTADFSALKMLGNLYIIDNPKELAKLARDANMFGGTLSPEDLYEFLQARADFRSIEKAIDKEMYGFKISEDCCIA